LRLVREGFVIDHHCPHRGTQLCVGYVEGDEISCLYHGWKLGGDGLCTVRPGEKGKSGGGVRTGFYPMRQFLGLIYAFWARATRRPDGAQGHRARSRR
jgi:5,5'-dehydrodivanillate O-demethylase